MGATADAARAHLGWRVAAVSLAVAGLAAGPAAMAQLGGGLDVQLGNSGFVTAVAVVDRMPVPVGEEFRVAVELRIDEGLHVQANPASEESFIATEIAVVAPGLEHVGIRYPDPQLVTFDFWPMPLAVYEGDVVAGLRLRLDETAALGPRDLSIEVRYQACNDLVCYAPATATALLALDVVAAGSDSRKLMSPLLDRARFDDQDETSHSAR